MRFTHLLVLLLIIFSLILFSCASSINEKSKSTVSSQKEIMHPTPSQSIPPGTANVSAAILTCEKKKDYFSCSFRIITVHGYGSATPLLPPGSEIIIEIVKINFKERNPPLSQTLQPGNILKMSLSYNQALSRKNSISSWQAIHIY